MESGKDKRRYTRYKLTSEVTASLGGDFFRANINEFSLGGLSFHIDKKPITPGAIIDLKIKDLNLDIQGRVVWTKEEDPYLKVGIERLSIYGNLKHFPLSDIFLGLQRSEKTGILEMKNSPILKKIYIKNGDMIFATSNQEEDRLGEVLVKAGKLTLEQYYQSIESMKKTGKRQGAVLVELGYLKPKDLIWAVTHQVEEIILSLFQWKDGEFEFKEVALPSEEVIILKLSAANLIYRGIKRIDNFTYLKDGFFPMDAVPDYSADPMDLFQDIRLEPQDKEILFLIDGSRNVQGILSLSPLDNLQTMKMLYALMNAKLIEITEKGQEREDTITEEILKEPEEELDSAFVEKVEELHNRLPSIDYYNILGISKWSTPDEIKRAYLTKAKEFHPDRHFSLMSETLKNKLNTLFSHLTMAYKTLSNPQMKMEYDQDSSFKAVSMEGRTFEIAKAKFEEGKKAFWDKLYAEAAELFGQAAYLDSSVASYHFYFGMALAKVKKLREAQEAINRALTLDPLNANYITELGHIYLVLGFNSRAKAAFEKAIQLDPSNKRAAEGLQKIGDHPGA
jgi:curved DNA-binding protein CbpA